MAGRRSVVSLAIAPTHELLVGPCAGHIVSAIKLLAGSAPGARDAGRWDRAKVITGLDDHSRYSVIAKVVRRATGRTVCDAFVAAPQRYGVPDEVLSDNGKQFTGRFTKPRPGEVLFERICRDNGITGRLTPPRTPTTTGKIERFQCATSHLVCIPQPSWEELEGRFLGLMAYP